MRDILKTEDEKRHSAQVRREKLFERIKSRRTIYYTSADLAHQFITMVEYGEMIVPSEGEIYKSIYGDRETGTRT